MANFAVADFSDLASLTVVSLYWQNSDFDLGAAET